ncbi:hypothetical protein ATY79_22200 [Rhizobium sp. R693]|nr:hypothetical protein ATY79_22200 [Rhizobium sp. R693]
MALAGVIGEFHDGQLNCAERSALPDLVLSASNRPAYSARPARGDKRFQTGDELTRPDYPIVELPWVARLDNRRSTL